MLSHLDYGSSAIGGYKLPFLAKEHFSYWGQERIDYQWRIQDFEKGVQKANATSDFGSPLCKKSEPSHTQYLSTVIYLISKWQY